MEYDLDKNNNSTLVKGGSSVNCDNDSTSDGSTHLETSRGNAVSSSKSLVHTQNILGKVRSIVPTLDCQLHKGECGRICIFGGCNLYTGAPYFAAISALRTGADIVHIFCEQSAGTVIKSYSSELIVHPVLDTEYVLEEIDKWLPRFNAIVIGPGLGRDQSMLGRISIIIERVKRAGIPLVIDADGLWHIIQSPELIVNSRHVLVTPNAMEFCNLAKAVLKRQDLLPNTQPDPQIVAGVARCLGGGVTIVHKGASDVISNGRHTEACSGLASPRRCGGQGDILSGACAVFMHWATSCRLLSRKAAAAGTAVSNTESLGDSGRKSGSSSSASRQRGSGRQSSASVTASSQSTAANTCSDTVGVTTASPSCAFNSPLLSAKCPNPGPGILAAWAACQLTREAAREAYVQHGRSCTTSDVISHVGPAFRRLFDCYETDIL